MTENKSRGIFGRSALRAGAAGLTLALAASLAPGFISWSNPAPAAAAQDPIDSPGEWLAKKTVNGKVFLDRDGNAAAAGSSDEPLAGVKVYAQWIDYNNKKQRGAVSPVYTTQTKADGTYTISLPDWTDALGTVHKWEATAGQKLRIWAENPDPANLQVAFIEGDSVFGGQGDRYLGTWNGTVGIQLAENYNISYHEREQDWLHLPEDKSTTGEKQVGQGRVSGRVYYDQRGTYGNVLFVNHYQKRYGDVAVPNVKIRGSYVQDEVARRFDQWKNDNKGYTTEAFRAAQKQIMAEYEAETGKSAIAETVITETDNEGKYNLQFKGLWGNSYKNNGITRDGEWGELAPDSETGSWLAGNWGSKHINYEYMYVSPVLPEGVDSNMDSSQSAMFQDIHRASMVHAVSGGLHAGNYINDLDFSLRQTSRGFDVTPYNATDKPAAPGDTAQTETFGLTPNTAHVIVWTDSEGKEVHRCEANSDNLGVIPSCDFKVPEDLAKDTLYTATVYNASDESTALMADSFLAYVAPEYKETEVKVGEEATAERPVNKNGTAVPDSAKFAAATAEDVKNAPEFQKAGLPEDAAPQDWVTVNADGTLTIKPGEDVKPGTYNVPVKVTYEDGTTKVINAPIKVVDETKQADEFEPAYEDKLVVPGEETKSSPTFTDKDGKETQAPEGSKFSIPEDFKAPEGYEVKIDENTGEITVTFPDESKLNKDTVEEFDVPVTVTYPDGSTDEAPAKFKLDTDGDGDPDVTDPDDDNDGIPDEEDQNPKVPDQNTIYEPGYEDGSGKPGEDVKVEKPEFKDKDGKVTTPPEGTTFGPGDNAPDGVTIDPNTGEITVTIPEDAKPGDKITVPVEVTYPDGSKDNVDVTVTVEEPDAPDTKQNEEFEPGYEDGSGKPGDDVKIDEPTFKDKDGNAATPPEGTTFGPGEGAPDGVTVDENTGEITVTIPEDAKPGDKITVPVEVTYPDGSKDNVDVTVTVEEPDAPDTKQNEEFEPGYEDGSGKPGSDVKIDEPTFKDKDGNAATPPEGTTFGPGEGAPDGVTIDPNTGEITVTIPEDAKPGDKITVPVEVTYPDGSKDNVDVTVTVTEPDAKETDADNHTPGYEDGSGKPGEDVKIDKPEFKDKDGKVTTPPEGTTFGPGEGTPDGVKIDENTGEITVTIPEDAKPGDKITVPVEVTYPDGSKDKVDVTVTVEEPDTPEVEKPDWNDDKGKPGDKVEIPNTGGPVPDGSTVETEGPGKAEIDEDGNLIVDIDKDAKPGDKIVVVVKDKDGNEIDRVVVEVEKPDTPETKKPDWKDDKGKPGDKVEIPNTGGPVPDGSTVETEGPGKAEIDENGNLIVDIDKDAKPGDKVVVVVKDKDGNEIDRVVVEVEKPADDGKGKDSDKYQPEYPDTNVKPGEKVEIPLKPGKLPKGTTCEIDMSTVPAGWNVSMGKNCTLIVVPGKDAKPGDIGNIEVDFTYPDGSKDTATAQVTVAQPDAPAPAPAPGKETPGNGGDLARTGAQVAGVAGIAAAMIAAGFGLAFMRRRRAGEEN